MLTHGVVGKDSQNLSFYFLSLILDALLQNLNLSNQKFVFSHRWKNGIENQLPSSQG